MKKATTLFLTKNASHQLFVNKFTTPFFEVVQNSRQLLQYGFLFVLLVPFCSKLNATNDVFRTILRDSIPQKNTVAPTSIFRWEYSEDKVHWQFYASTEKLPAQKPTSTTYFRRLVKSKNTAEVVDLYQIFSVTPSCGVTSLSIQPTTCGLNNGIITFQPVASIIGSAVLQIQDPVLKSYSIYQDITSGTAQNLPSGNYQIVWNIDCFLEVTLPSSPLPILPGITDIITTNQSDCEYGNLSFQVVTSYAEPTLQYRLDGGNWQSSPIFDFNTSGTHLFEIQKNDTYCPDYTESYQNNFSEIVSPIISEVAVDNLSDCTAGNVRITVNLSQGQGFSMQYRLDGGAWQWSNVFNKVASGSHVVYVQAFGNNACNSNYSFSFQETVGVKIISHSIINTGICDTTSANVSITLQSNAATSTPSVQYKLGTGVWQNSNVFSGLGAGTYNFYIKASDGCSTGTGTAYGVTISAPRMPVIRGISTSNLNDCNLNNVGIKVLLKDTTFAVKYRINGGTWGTSSSFTGLSTGTYLLEVATSSNLACIASYTAGIIETGSVTISSITVANQSDCTPNNMMLTAVHNGGTQTGLEFQLTGTGIWQANNPQFTGLTTNTYSIQARIRNSTCTYPVSVKTITVTETLYPTIVSDTVTGIKDCIKNNARATLRLQNSSMLAQYRITNLSNTWQNSNVFSNLTTGVYQVQVAAQGNTTCIQNYTLNVDEGLGSIDSLTVTNNNDCTNRNIQLKVNYTASALSNIQFRINGGAYQASPIFTGLTTGTFLVESNTANGCKSSRSTGAITEVLVPEITNLQASNDADCIVGNMNATVLYTTNGVTLGPITFRLNGGAWQSGVNFSNLPSGTYLVEASSTKCFAPKQVTLNEKKPPIIQDVVITNTADTCASRLDFKVILSNFDSTQQYQYAIASGPTWQASNQFSSQYPFSYNFLVKSTTTTCTGTTFSKDFTSAKRGAKYSSITLANDNDCISGNMIVTVNTDAIAATPTDAWYPHTRDQWFRADNGSWVQYPSKLNNISAGSHSIQVRYKNCIDSARVTLSERIPIRVGSVAIGNQNDCIKGNATATITALNTLGSIRYALGSGAYQLSNPTFSSLSSGNYLARVLDDGGCKDSLAFSVLENEPPLASIAGVNALCAGQSTTLSASGGTAYLWSTGATTAAITISPSVNTTYTVTVTQNGCSAVVSKTITPTPTITGVTSLCTGQSTTLTASTGSSYLWSTGATTAAITITPAATTTYTVTVTQSGCSLAASQVVTVTPYPIPVITGASTLCSGQPASLTASGGTAYLWSTGATTASINPTPLANTTYSVTVSQNGCSATASKAITVTALPTPLITGVQNICAGQSTTLTASGGTTYLWSTGATTAAVSLTPSATTTYSVTVTQNGCSAVTSKQVNVTPYPTIAGVTSICSSQSTTLTASTGSSYTWSTGSRNATISVTPATNTTYSVTVTQNGCTAVASQLVTVTSYPSPTISGGSNICAGQSTTLSVVAAAGYSYSWSTGETTSSITATPATTTTYSVTVSQNGCSSGSSKSVNVTALPTPAISGVSSICAGQSATLTASGGTAYLWSTGATTASITATPSSTTTYTVTVTQNGCSATASKQLSVTPLPTISGVSTVCAGQPATLTASSGSTYLWSIGATTASISPTPAINTTYTVTVTLNGCSASASKLVSVTPLPTASIAGSSTICAGQPANLTASGGTAYAWSTGATTAAISPSPAVTTTYTVTVTQNGCSAVASQVVNVTPLPTPIITGVSTICAGQPANLTASGGTAYAWSTGATSTAISPSPTVTTTYTVTVSQNGCNATASKQVTVTPLPSAVITGVSSICNGQPANLTASGGTAYAWSTGATTAAITPTPSSNTTYTVTVTANGCTSTASQAVVVKALPLVAISGPSAVCQGQSASLYSVYTADSYLWSNGATTAGVSVTPGGYSLTVTTNGCSNSAGFGFSVIQTTGASISGPASICLGSTARLTANGSGTYQWSNGSTASFIDVTPTAPGTYQYSVNSFTNGCPGLSGVYTLTVSAPLTLGYQLQNDQDCIPNNTAIIPIATNAQGAVSYIISPLGTTDFSVDLQGKGSGKYTLSGIDTKGCTASTVIDIKEAQPVTLSYQLDNPDDCIKGNASLRVRALTGNGSIAITLGGYSVPNGLFTLGSGTYQFQALDSIGCSASLSVTIDEKLPTFMVTQGNLQDCDPNNTQLTINGNSARGALLYKLDQGSTQTDPIFSNVPVGTHKLSLTDTKGCRDSVTVVVENNCLVDYDYTGVSSCDTTDGELVIYPIKNGGSQQFSIDNGVNWINNNSFKGLAPGNYTPAIKKLPLGCVIYGDSIAISDTCQRYAVAAFTKDTLLITNPRQLVRFPWKIQTPRWMHRDSFGLKLQLKGDGAPHFIEYNVDGGSLATLRGERLFAQRLYRNGFSGLDRDSTALASTAGLFKYPQDYVFTLTSDNPSKLKVDPDHGTLRVVVLLDADSDTYSEQPLIICKGESVTLNPGLGSCFNWNDGSFQGSRTITPTHDTTYSVTILDDQLRQTIKVYHIKVVNLMVKIIPTDAQKRTCTAEPVKLTAQVSGAPNAQLIQYRWNTGETTASVTISSSKPYTPATRTVTVTYAIAPGQICSAVTSVDVAKLFETQDANICDNIYAKMKALGFEGFACTVIPKLPLMFPTLRGNGTITDYSHYDIASDGNNIPLAARLTKIIDILRAKGYNANGYLTDADNVCNGSEFDAVKTLFEQDLDDYDVWVHVVKCDRAGNGYYFIRLNKEIINLDDTFLALLFEDRTVIATYPVYQFILSEANYDENGDLEIYYNPTFITEFSKIDSAIIVNKLAYRLLGGITGTSRKIYSLANTEIKINTNNINFNNSRHFKINLAYKARDTSKVFFADPFYSKCDTINKIQKYSFSWYLNDTLINSSENNEIIEFSAIANSIHIGTNYIKVKITNNCSNTTQSLVLTINYHPIPTQNNYLAIKVHKNGKLLGTYKQGQIIGDRDHGDKPLKNGDQLSIQLGKIGINGVFDTLNNGIMFYKASTSNNSQMLDFIFNYSDRGQAIRAERSFGKDRCYFYFYAEDTTSNKKTTIGNPFSNGPRLSNFSPLIPRDPKNDSVRIFQANYQKALDTIKKYAFAYYSFFDNKNISIQFNITHLTIGGTKANNLITYVTSAKSSQLELVDTIMKQEYKILDENGKKMKQTIISNATLVSRLTDDDKNQLFIANGFKMVTENAEEIISRIQSRNPQKAIDLKQKILNGTFSESDTIGAIYNVNEIDAQEIRHPNNNGIIGMELDAVDLTTPKNMAMSILHEMAHIIWGYTEPLSSLKWEKIREFAPSRKWIIGDDLLTNINQGFCSTGRGHERLNDENTFVCRVANNIK